MEHSNVEPAGEIKWNTWMNKHMEYYSLYKSQDCLKMAETKHLKVNKSTSNPK